MSKAERFSRLYHLLTELAGQAGPADPQVQAHYREACELLIELEHGPLPSPLKGDCIVFDGHIDRDGYGKTTYKGKVIGAHRAAYMEAKGTIPAGFQIDHLCFNRACINPEHLEAVTPAENSRRVTRRQTHCRHGHEYSPENTYWRFDGAGPQRGCKACREEARKRYRDKVAS